MRKIYQSDLESVVNELIDFDSIQIAVRGTTRALLMPTCSWLNEVISGTPHDVMHDDAHIHHLGTDRAPVAGSDLAAHVQDR